MKPLKSNHCLGKQKLCCVKSKEGVSNCLCIAFLHIYFLCYMIYYYQILDKNTKHIILNSDCIYGEKRYPIN